MGEKIIKKILSIGHTKAIGSQDQPFSHFLIMLPILKKRMLTLISSLAEPAIGMQMHLE
ncbi:hypothetical protein P4534_20890 [Peribacillus butanolivorans]|uniref:hypothetical protein n=1 Tax=Peribacillus butanolivorans TaxID=421767 RepID=UPI002E240DF6|nr:hypothetical protein [Peribacillus butanolivorans]